MTELPTLRLWFEDMWGYEEFLFCRNDNYFFDLFSQRYSIVLDEENPSLLVYSCFGVNHKKYNCPKIFFSGENIPNPNPAIKVDYDPSECDLFLGKHPDGAHTIYLPLWVLFINWFNKEQPRPLPSNPTYHVSISSLINSAERVDQLIDQERDFCCFINNNFIYDRIKLYLLLLNEGPVSSYGKLFNDRPSGKSLRGSELDKLNILEKYRLTIAFENSYFPGYNTEKIIHPFARGCMPFYNGGLDDTIFNRKSLFYLPDYGYDYNEMIRDAKFIVMNKDRLRTKLLEPLFLSNCIPCRFLPQNVLASICDRINVDAMCD